LGGTGRLCAGIWRISGIYFAASAGLGGSGRYRSSHRFERNQVLADMGRGIIGRSIWRLGLLLDRAETRIQSPAYVSSVSASRSHSARRDLHEEMGHSGNFHWPLLRTASCHRAIDSGYILNAILAFSDRKFRVRLCLGCDIADDRRCHLQGCHLGAVVVSEAKIRRDFVSGGLFLYCALTYFS